MSLTVNTGGFAAIKPENLTELSLTGNGNIESEKEEGLLEVGREAAIEDIDSADKIDEQLRGLSLTGPSSASASKVRDAYMPELPKKNNNDTLVNHEQLQQKTEYLTKNFAAIAGSLVNLLSATNQIAKNLGQLMELGMELMNNQGQNIMNSAAAMKDYLKTEHERIEAELAAEREKAGGFGALFAALEIVAGAIVMGLGIAAGGLTGGASAAIGTVVGAALIIDGTVKLGASIAILTSKPGEIDDETCMRYCQTGMWGVTGQYADKFALAFAIVTSIITCGQGLMSAGANLSKAILTSGFVVANSAVTLYGTVSTIIHQIKEDKNDEAAQIDQAAAMGLAVLILREIIHESGLHQKIVDSVGEAGAQGIEMGLFMLTAMASAYGVSKAASASTVSAPTRLVLEKFPSLADMFEKIEARLATFNAGDIAQTMQKVMVAVGATSAFTQVFSSTSRLLKAIDQQKIEAMCADMNLKQQFYTAQKKVFEQLMQSLQRATDVTFKEMESVSESGTNALQTISSMLKRNGELASQGVAV